jgi:hypothetical protein
MSKATSSGRSLSVRVDIDAVVASASNYVAAIKGIGDAIIDSIPNWGIMSALLVNVRFESFIAIRRPQNEERKEKCHAPHTLIR